MENRSVDDLLDFVLGKFTCVFRAAFFMFFILASEMNQKSGWEILFRSQKAKIFKEIFSGLANFVDFDAGGNLNLIECQGEVRI